MSAETIEEAAAHNAALVARDGPRLRSDYSTWVLARDRTNGMILLGGLGGFGNGVMWVLDENVVHRSDYSGAIGFADAPEEDWRTSPALGGGRDNVRPWEPATKTAETIKVEVIVRENGEVAEYFQVNYDRGQRYEIRLETPDGIDRRDTHIAGKPVGEVKA